MPLNLKNKVKQASRKSKKLRLSVSGQPGAGKTYGALMLARTIAGDEAKIFVFDTEAGRASLYADQFKFDVWEFDPVEEGRAVSYKDYIDVIAYAEKEKYDVVILDSSSAEWDDIQNIHSAMKGNSYQNWGKVKANQHQAFLDAILYSKVHVITTIRSKEKTEMVDGRVISKGVGEQQESNLKYFMDFVFTILDRESHEGLLEKAPPGIYDKYQGITVKITEKLCKEISDWLDTGIPVEIYDFITRIKLLNSEHTEFSGKAWPKMQADDELAKKSKEELTALGKELAAEVKQLKEQQKG